MKTPEASSREHFHPELPMEPVEALGQSEAFLEFQERLSRVAPVNRPVLLVGERGTGKELAAWRLHFLSTRWKGPLVALNCSALAPSLIASELFGYEKGAFTGAEERRTGRFEAADGGTLFLDEIGDLPLNVQIKLLRVLQLKSFERVGSSQTTTVDVRIIAATNQDIEQLVQDGTFRADLYYRLNVLPIYIPPLRDRKEDILILSQYFLKRYEQQTNKKIPGFTQEAKAQLLSYSWPGNVRELENAIERAAVVTPENELIDQEAIFSESFSTSPKDQYQGKNLKEAVNIFKRQFVANTLNANGWNQTRSAEVLGIQRTYLSRLIKELNIDKDQRS